MTKLALALAAFALSFTLGVSFAQAQAVPPAGDTGTTLQNPLGDVRGGAVEVFSRAARAMNGFTSILALVLVVVGGYYILTARGNEEQYAKGKKIVGYSLIGLLVTLASYTILATVVVLFTGGERATTYGALIDPLNIVNKGGEAGYVLYGGRILRFMLGGLGALSVLMFVYAGFLWLTAAGSEEKVGKARKTILYAVIGLTIVLTSYFIVTTALQFSGALNGA